MRLSGIFPRQPRGATPGNVFARRARDQGAEVSDPSARASVARRNHKPAAATTHAAATTEATAHAETPRTEGNGTTPSARGSAYQAAVDAITNRSLGRAAATARSAVAPTEIASPASTALLCPRTEL